MQQNKQDSNIKEEIKVNQNNIEYIVWTHADIVKPYIKKFLIDKFNGKLVVSEFNQIDLSIPEENLPIEIQSTVVTKKCILYAGWEKTIRPQIEQNIVNHGRCWFFFDSELFRSMKNCGKHTSINMDWFTKYIKEGKLKIFTVRYNGDIEEKEYKDFKFISEISQTCKIAHDLDSMILNQNKMNIFYHVLKGHNFTQSEIDNFENSFDNRNDTNKRKIGFLKEQNDNKTRLYGQVLQSMANLSEINQLFTTDLNRNKNSFRAAKYQARTIGIFEITGYTHKVITKFVDKFDICKYFPGYVRNKNTWDNLKGHELDNDKFDNITIGEDSRQSKLEF